MSDILKPVLDKQKSKLKSSYVISNTLAKQSPETTNTYLYHSKKSLFPQIHMNDEDPQTGRSHMFPRRRESNKGGTRLPAVVSPPPVHNNVSKFLLQVTERDQAAGSSFNDRYQINDNSFILPSNMRSGSMRNLSIQARFTRELININTNINTVINTGLTSPLAETAS